MALLSVGVWGLGVQRLACMAFYIVDVAEYGCGL